MRFIVAETKSTSLRFVSVGIANTLIDFGIYTILIASGVSSLIANYPATTTAMVFSFFANKKYTFKDNSKVASKQVLTFLIVTLFGLWVLQPITIYLVEGTARHITTSDIVGSIVAKLAATIVSLTWNYILYSRFVFTKKESE
jgi:putative flippase GtrA